MTDDAPLTPQDSPTATALRNLATFVTLANACFFAPFAAVAFLVAYARFEPIVPNVLEVGALGAATISLLLSLLVAVRRVVGASGGAASLVSASSIFAAAVVIFAGFFCAAFENRPNMAIAIVSVLWPIATQGLRKSVFERPFRYREHATLAIFGGSACLLLLLSVTCCSGLAYSNFMGWTNFPPQEVAGEDAESRMYLQKQELQEQGLASNAAAAQQLRTSASPGYRPQTDFRPRGPDPYQRFDEAADLPALLSEATPETTNEIMDMFSQTVEEATQQIVAANPEVDPRVAREAARDAVLQSMMRELRASGAQLPGEQRRPLQSASLRWAPKAGYGLSSEEWRANGIFLSTPEAPASPPAVRMPVAPELPQTPTPLAYVGIESESGIFAMVPQSWGLVRNEADGIAASFGDGERTQMNAFFGPFDESDPTRDRLIDDIVSTLPGDLAVRELGPEAVDNPDRTLSRRLLIRSNEGYYLVTVRDLNGYRFASIFIGVGEPNAFDLRTAQRVEASLIYTGELPQE